MAETRYVYQVVIYDSPSDFPDMFVARMMRISSKGGLEMCAEPLAVEDSLDATRAAVPDGFVQMGRSPDDDPVIVEVWL